MTKSKNNPGRGNTMKVMEEIREKDKKGNQRRS